MFPSTKKGQRPALLTFLTSGIEPPFFQFGRLNSETAQNIFVQATCLSKPAAQSMIPETTVHGMHAAYEC